MFELHITCTKDIEKLSIDFSDGSSVIKENKKYKEESLKKSIKEVSTKESNENKLIDIYKFKDTTNKEKKEIKLDIPDLKDRPVNIAQELDNLNI